MEIGTVFDWLSLVWWAPTGKMRTIRVSLIVTVTALAALCAWSGGLVAGSRDRAGEEVVQGVYRNTEYGYSVEIPAPLKARRLGAPAPQHGVAMELSQGEIWVNAEYDAVEAGSADGIATAIAEEWSKSDSFRIDRRVRTTLAGLPAVELVLNCSNASHDSGRIHLVVGFRAVPDGVGVVYTVGLKARSADAVAERVFSEIVRSFRVRALPH